MCWEKSAERGPYLGVRGGKTNDGFETSRRYWEGPLVLSAPHLGISVGNELPRPFREDRAHPGLGKVQILAQEIVLKDVVGMGIGVVRGSLVRRSSCSLPHRVSLGAFRGGDLVVIVVVIIAVVARLSKARPVSVPANDVAGNPSVAAGVKLVQNDEQQIETRKEGVGEANVLLDAAAATAAAPANAAPAQPGSSLETAISL